MIMQQDLLYDIKLITTPFAHTWTHVQGPGGNTSVKGDDAMLIKASGFTFKDVVDGAGLVWIDYNQVLKNLTTDSDDFLLEGKSVRVIRSTAEGLKPSMEFEFHAALGKYVLHTHSVYVNVVMCAISCESLLKAIFPDIAYELIPYLMPGHPLASYIYKLVQANEKTSIYFLKNHGIIIHGETAQEVLEKYKLVEERIIDYLKLPVISNSLQDYPTENMKTISFKAISQRIENFSIEDIRDLTLVPDQSIFFRNKVSEVDHSASIYINEAEQCITLQGTPKFIAAAHDMLKMVLYY